jgi:type VI secretion system protein ImpH
MAAPDRLASADVIGGAFSPSSIEASESAFALLQSAPERFDLFAALRLIEAAFPNRPRLGEGRRARDDPVRLGQPPFLVFPPAQIASCTVSAEGVGRLATYAFGLFGPHGPLPLHVTVRALDRSRYSDDSVLVHFIDIFHHRMASLFYRAWAKARPAVEYDRPATDRFARRLASLGGAPTRAFLGRSALPDGFTLYAAGLFAMQGRMPEVLERLIRLFFDVPVRIREFVGGWLEIPPEERTRLGAPADFARLARGSVVGTRCFARHHRFRVMLGPLRLQEFERFLPPGGSLAALAAIVRRFVGLDLEWELQLLLRRDEVPTARLGGGERLAWTSWLDTAERDADAGDLVLAFAVRDATEDRFDACNHA